LLDCRIKTQDAIFGELATERLLEIGPAETLTNMASKTVDADYRVRDVAWGVQRELLSYNRDAPAIYHDGPDQEPAASTTTSAVPVVPDAASAPVPTPTPTTPAAAQTTNTAVAAPTAAAVSVPDKAITPQDTITTLVALGLAKGSSDIPQDQTLKALCGGRCTTRPLQPVTHALVLFWADTRHRSVNGPE
jgi:fatty acid synthase subunit alpha